MDDDISLLYQTDECSMTVDGLQIECDGVFVSVEGLEAEARRMKDLLIFDMDGVLIDSEPLHERAKREALSEAGIIVPESLFASYTGRSDRAMIYEVAAGHGLNEQRSAEILDRKHRIYESLEHTLRPVSGAIEFVHWA